MTEKNEVLGLLTQRSLTNLLANYKLNIDSNILKAVQKEFKKLHLNDSLKNLSRSFNRHQYVLVEGSGNYHICENKHLLEKILS